MKKGRKRSEGVKKAAEEKGEVGKAEKREDVMERKGRG